MSFVHRLIAFVTHPRGERGLSQSTESAVLLAGAVVVAGLVVGAVTVYVSGHLPK